MTEGFLVRVITCSHKENTSTEQDVVPPAVDASDANAQAAQHQQDGAEDGEEAGGSHDTCPCDMVRKEKKKKGMFLIESAV